jgi:predicted AAA+ superfamily ATPase
MQRYLNKQIYADSQNKIILLSGPRQTGKTTLVKSLFENFSYLNYDSALDRDSIKKLYWSRDSEVVIFDELHKMPEWKRYIKGIYDTEGLKPRLIITGSVNMDSFAKVGDSLAGRYFQFRLHPIDLKEALEFWGNDVNAVFERLYNFGGFPEPFLAGNSRFYKRWSKTHLDIILRQDFLDIYAIRSIKSIEILTDLLIARVGGSIAYANLAGDLQVDSKSVKNWLQLLENFYLVFSVTPYHTNVARSLLREPKYYFYDIARVRNEAARLENLVACALIKQIHYLEDTEGVKGSLHYLRTKDGKELDFLVVIDEKPILAIEIKTSDAEPSRNFEFFRQYLNIPHCYQLVLNLKREFDTPTSIKIRSLVKFLAELDLATLISYTESGY